MASSTAKTTPEALNTVPWGAVPRRRVGYTVVNLVSSTVFCMTH